jgi:PhnB protein
MVTETLRLYAGLQRHFHLSKPTHSQENPMQVQPYLMFEGRCEEALNFYKKAVNAEVTALMRFSEMPASAETAEPAGPDGCAGGAAPPPDSIMHSSFKVGQTEIMASDGMAAGKAEFKGITLALSAATDADTKRLFDALSDGGSVQMPLATTFWTSSFGMLTDRFGVPWMVMTESGQ